MILLMDTIIDQMIRVSICHWLKWCNHSGNWDRILFINRISLRNRKIQVFWPSTLQWSDTITREGVFRRSFPISVHQAGLCWDAGRIKGTWSIQDNESYIAATTNKQATSNQPATSNPPATSKEASKQQQWITKTHKKEVQHPPPPPQTP